MGYVADVLDVLRGLVSILNGSEEHESAYDIRDEICYSGDYRDIRSYLLEWGMSIEPGTKITLQLDPKQGECYVLNADRRLILTLTTEDNADILDMDDDELFNLVYEEYWDVVKKRYDKGVE